MSVKANRARKNLLSLLDKNGVEQFDDASKGEITSDYFKELFTSSNPQGIPSMFQDFQPRVSSFMNAQLIREVTSEEIRQAAFAIDPSSAPGLDGMTGMFFQKNWDIVGKQVIDEIKIFFQHQVMPIEWNYTHLCLIPKIDKAKSMTDLRPISLCSVLYKIISKIMVKRLQPFLPQIISTNQSAFVAQRLITDNILVAHELIHSLKAHPKISEEYMALKSDMSKAFDRVEWIYLRSLLQALGFHKRWVDWIMLCVSSVTFSVIINDQPLGLITPQRGLRQGDPLSPFLFVLCTEGLSHMLKKAEDLGYIDGISFHEDGPSVTHLLFADDSLFFCKATSEQCHSLQNILHSYGTATGQVVNPGKSSIFFGTKNEETSKTGIQDTLQVFNEGGEGKYLGLPESFSGSKIEVFKFLEEKLKGKLSGWFSRSLSMGGKEVLLKAVGLSLPIHAMSCFLLPKTTCQHLTSAMSHFWWSSLEHKNKIHWLAWDNLCLPKEHGGLGFKDLESFNLALLGKQAWRILTDPCSLFSQVLKSRYFPQEDFLSAIPGSKPSFGWTSILAGRDLITPEITKNVGNGASISVWLDRWVVGEDGIFRAPMRKQVLFDLSLRVSDLIDFTRRSWNSNLLDDLFFPEDLRKIKKIKPVVSVDDFWTWNLSKRGNYTVSSAYHLAFERSHRDLIADIQMQPSLNALKASAWKMKTVPKVKTFFWKVLCGAISAADRLIQRGVKADERCQICGKEGEDINHILFQCPFARQVWALSNIPSPENGFEEGSIYSNIHYLLDLGLNKEIGAEIQKIVPWIAWNIWKSRNKFVFEARPLLPNLTVKTSLEDVAMWSEAQLDEVDWENQRLVGRGNEAPPPERDQGNTWSAPPESWLKCNVGVVWSEKEKGCGGSWVLRDHNGKVLLHSRRFFKGIENPLQAHLVVSMWSAESMSFHRVNQVIFSLANPTLVGSVLRPNAWPNFSFYGIELLFALSLLTFWRLELAHRGTNRGAHLIAQSALKQEFRQSYVASCSPQWLHNIFADEMVRAS